MRCENIFWLFSSWEEETLRINSFRDCATGTLTCVFLKQQLRPFLLQCVSPLVSLRAKVWMCLQGPFPQQRNIYFLFSFNKCSVTFLSLAIHRCQTSIFCPMALRDLTTLKPVNDSSSSSSRFTPQSLPLFGVTQSRRGRGRDGEQATASRRRRRPCLSERQRSVHSLSGTRLPPAYLPPFHFRLYELAGMQERARGRRAGAGKWRGEPLWISFVRCG